MAPSPLQTGPRSAGHARVLDSPTELKLRLEAERRGVPFLHLRNADGEQRLVALDQAREELSVGRSEQCDLCLNWDQEVSWLHAHLKHSAGSWMIHDDGLSRNGTFVNGERIHGHKVLRDRDRVRAGATDIYFCDPAPQRAQTAPSHELGVAQAITPAQRKVLVALCAPYRDRPRFASPPSNLAIATELVLSIDAVKSHLRALFAAFGLEDLPRNQKRVRLIEEAFARGVVGPDDFE